MAPVFAFVQRKGDVRAFHIERVTAANLERILQENVDSSSRVMTDELNAYNGLSKYFASHETVNHSRYEYARGDVTTNTIEGFFSILKRGFKGTYHHVSRKHLHRYLHEFAFRYNARGVDDGLRTDLAIAGAEGKRLKYHG